MRKAVAIIGVTGALTLGGAGMAHAATYDSPVPEDHNDSRSVRD